MTSAIGWRHEKRFFMTSANGWRHEKRFFMTSANGWRHEKRFFMTSAIGWRHKDQWLHHDTVKRGLSPLAAQMLHPILQSISYNMYSGRMFTNDDTGILVERMLEWNSGCIVLKQHSFFLLQFPWRNKLQSCSSCGKQDERDILFGCTYSRESLTVGLVCTTIVARVESCSTAFFVLG
jgi:hypothetical protein